MNRAKCRNGRFSVGRAGPSADRDAPSVFAVPPAGPDQLRGFGSGKPAVTRLAFLRQSTRTMP